MTLIEVIVSALLVGLISLSLLGLDAVGRTTADQQRRAQAFTVAQADQERIKGLSADQIANLNQTRTVTLDGVAFTVTSAGQFLSSSASNASCSSTAAAADYAKVSSTVDWASNKRADVVVQSVVTPRAGGSLLAQVVDQNGAGLPGVRVDVAGADPNTDSVHRFGTTDTPNAATGYSGGCTIFGTLLEGDYTVAPTLAGYVDKDGDPAPTATVTTTAGNTTTQQFSLGQAGRDTANFSTVIGATTFTGQLAPSLSWFNAGMPSAINGFVAPATPASAITTPQTLFPFYVTAPGTYTANYNMWAGKCMSAQPPVATPSVRRYATVSPGGAFTNTGADATVGAVREPAMFIDVTYPNSSGTPVRVRPDHIELTNGCGENWQPPVASTYSTTTGWLQFPGQPYGNANYTVCVDYLPSGQSTSRKSTTTLRSNTNFTAANVIPTFALTSSSTSGTC
ncbi:MAG: hypothetical protein QOI10_3432 [Solirubrobacterales bacterium]|nr:hypothetical protein [Solirubrobacterales bacterium]